MKNTLRTSIASLIVLNFCWFCTANEQNNPQKKDTFVKNHKEQPKSKKNQEAYNLGILLEYIRLDHRTANKLIRKFATRTAHADPLREELEALIDSGNATLEHTDWITTRTGQVSRIESVTERIYASEYEPPKIPSNLENFAPADTIKHSNQADQPIESSNPPLSSFPLTPASPTAFKARNLGPTMEVAPAISADQRIIDLQLAPEIVEELAPTFFNREGAEATNIGVDHIQMPTFYVRRINTSVTVATGEHCLLGIQKPQDNNEDRVLVLVRADLIPVHY